MGILKNLLCKDSDLKQRLEQQRVRLYRLAYSWSHNPTLSDDLVQDAMVKAIKNVRQLQFGSSPQQAASKIMLHVTTDDPVKLATMLDETEDLLNLPEAEAKNVHVAIMANGEGLDLLRVDTRKFANRIQLLQARYNNLTFMACKKAMNRLAQKTGAQVSLLPNTKTIPTTPGEVIRRKQQGWIYIKI